MGEEHQELATRIAVSLPTTAEEAEDDTNCITLGDGSCESVRACMHWSEEVIPLQDIVVTAIEHNEFHHFRVRMYNPDASGFGKGNHWAVVQGLPGGFKGDGTFKPPFVSLDATTVRVGVIRYLSDRLSKGMPEDEARKMVDGVYTDVIVCDSIIQFILYGEEVFG